LPLKPVQEVLGLTHIDFSKNKAGDIGELYASVALMAKGASVFKNTGCDGKTDLCFKYKGQVYEIDVKLASCTITKTGARCWRSSDAQFVKYPVYPLIVVPATGVDLSGWYCRWYLKAGQARAKNKKYQCPPGLETFWS
jgi:hypothetical protein